MAPDLPLAEGASQRQIASYIVSDRLGRARNRTAPNGFRQPVYRRLYESLALGRFVEFSVRSDSATSALGLETAQWTSIALIVVAVGGAWATRLRRRAHGSQ